ncbi:MAG: ATP-dependent DNA helicase RecG [Treponema sp.]|jgi:ATP-dependent DNA helicase RecG|nr:ATP-dependent DNA helicase RecG [Treponema sp.]
MFLRELREPVNRIKGAGPAAAANLSRLGITTAGALLCHYPRDLEDRSRTVSLIDWNKARVCTEVKVLSKDWFGFGRMKTLKIHVEDETARACLVCFNRPFLDRQLPEGIKVRLYGHFYFKYGGIQSTAFEVEPVTTGSMNAILPVYPLTAGLTQGTLRKLVRRALDLFASQLEDELPEKIIRRDGLLRKGEAIKAIHFPASQEEYDKARKTLIYEELFYLEIMVGRRAMTRKGNRDRGSGIGDQGSNTGNQGLSPVPEATVSPAQSLIPLSPLQQRLLERLTFRLTPGQETATAEINRDMDSPFPMARLLQGDVGSGKTLVSFLAALKAIEGGGQAGLMAPTELLARQHAENAARLLEPLGIRIAFLTGNLKSAGRAQLLKALAAGEIDLIAGTHALFSRDVIYRDLHLVVVDEQHRFGVLQRQAIMAKGNSSDNGSVIIPDLLMMSATPIPRSLALTVFGDLDVSTIRDMPPGRKSIKTHLAKESNEGKVYDFVRKELAAGHQAYFVYPLIEGGDVLGHSPELNDLKDAVSMAERLAKEVFPDFPLALLHSKVDEEKKRQTMDAFRRGDIKILAATSVVEVGVDVPNASCMVIEHAERFGLSALHQLRGRVGRGETQSYCFLVFSDNLTEDGKTRLKVMLENSDGFIIAEEDLKLRGPGQISGLEQSGYLKLGIADPVRDAEELARARTDAFAILEADPALEDPANRRITEVLERAPPFGEMVY